MRDLAALLGVAVLAILAPAARASAPDGIDLTAREDRARGK